LTVFDRRLTKKDFDLRPALNPTKELYRQGRDRGNKKKSAPPEQTKIERIFIQTARPAVSALAD
jgi:hypothetical protein